LLGDSLITGTIACQKQDIASTDSSNKTQAEPAPYVDRREEIRNGKKAAIAELDKAIQQNPNDTEAYSKRGLLYLALSVR
jgi:Flp pilus assembly protein TadD